MLIGTQIIIPKAMENEVGSFMPEGLLQQFSVGPSRAILNVYAVLVQEGSAIALCLRYTYLGDSPDGYALPKDLEGLRDSSVPSASFPRASWLLLGRLLSPTCCRAFP